VEYVPPSPEDGNRSSFRNVVFSCLWNSGRWTKSKNLVVMSVTHHRQNPLECICIKLVDISDHLLQLLTCVKLVDISDHLSRLLTCVKLVDILTICHDY
jgi:hypothetical protein